MMSKLHWLTSVGLLVAALAHAQSPQDGAQNQSAELQQGSQVLARVATGPPPSSNSQKMYEDVEIMRRILNRKLGLWPGLIASNTNCAVCHNLAATHMGGDPAMLRRLSLDLLGTLPEPNSVRGGDLNQNVIDVFLAKDHQGYESAHTSLAVPTNVEGIYLKGQGIVYTVTLPPPPRSFALAAWIAESKPLSDWERVRQSVRGDQPQPQKSKPAKESSETGIFAELEKTGHLGLSEAVLRVLAENGHNFSQLAPDERVTVAVTFRQPSHTASKTQTGTQTGDPLNAWGSQEAPTTWEAQTFQPGGGGSGLSGGGFSGGSGFSGGGGLSGGGSISKTVSEGSSGGGTAGTSTGSVGNQTPASVRDFELLGDRLLKQGKYQEAVKAFQRALNLNPPTKQSAALYRKIAQADLAIEDDAAAKKALAMAEELLKEVADPTRKNSSGGGDKRASSSSLPSKLMISVPKRLLDQVGAGKISYDDFRRQATIDYFGFSPKSSN